MRIVHERASTWVPATSANLGPGFDSLGLALELRDHYVLEVTTHATNITVEGEGAGNVPLDDSHLVVQAIRETLETVGAPQCGIRLMCRNVIPHGRGLGSSAAAIVGGIALARAVIEEPEVLTDESMLDIATAIEGHPDNVAPAILGGLTIAYTDAGRPQAVRVSGTKTDGSDLVASLSPLIITPSGAVSTTKARALVPSSVPIADAAHNASRTALLIHALTSDPSLLLAATSDKLHQEARTEAMPASIALIRMLRHEGIPAVLSGAGPTVMVVAEAPDDIASRIASMVDNPGDWRIARVPVADSGVRAVLG